MYLGEGNFRWVMACALYPRLEWDLTLYLGEEIDPTLLRHDNLLRLTSLPWFRKGYFSIAMQQALFERLDREERRRLSAKVLSVLESGIAGSGVPATLEILVQHFGLSPLERLELHSDDALARLAAAGHWARIALRISGRVWRALFRFGIPSLGLRAWLLVFLVCLALGGAIGAVVARIPAEQRLDLNSVLRATPKPPLISVPKTNTKNPDVPRTLTLVRIFLDYSADRPADQMTKQLQNMGYKVEVVTQSHEAQPPQGSVDYFRANDASYAIAVEAVVRRFGWSGQAARLITDRSAGDFILVWFPGGWGAPPTTSQSRMRTDNPGMKSPQSTPPEPPLSSAGPVTSDTSINAGQPQVAVAQGDRVSDPRIGFWRYESGGFSGNVVGTPPPRLYIQVVRGQLSVKECDRYSDCLKAPPAGIGSQMLQVLPDGRLKFSWEAYAPEGYGAALVYYTRSDPSSDASPSVSNIQTSKKAEPPTLVFQASKTSLTAGESTLLSWNAQNADRLHIEPGIGDLQIKGSLEVRPLKSATYVATATGPGGSDSASVSVTVVSPTNPADRFQQDGQVDTELIPHQETSTEQPGWGNWLRQFGTLPPAQQEKQLENDPAFRSLAPEKQQKFLDRLRAFNSLSPEKKQQVLNRMETYEHLTSQQRQQADSLFQRYRGLPPDQQNQVSQAYKQLRQMSPAQREQYFNSDEFHNSLNDLQRNLLHEMSDLYPAPKN